MEARRQPAATRARVHPQGRASDPVYNSTANPTVEIFSNELGARELGIFSDNGGSRISRDGGMMELFRKEILRMVIT